MTPNPAIPTPCPPQGAFCAFRQMDGAWFLLAFGGASLLVILICTPAGGALLFYEEK